jgi:hypothetical protein
VTTPFSGKIRDYNASTDTASVELVHHGDIESWLDGLHIHPGVNRAFVVHGSDIDLAAPDLFRLAEAVITASGSQINSVAAAGSSGAISTKSGRGFIATGNTGAGSANISFSPAFVTAPNLTVAFDNIYTATIGGLTASGATISVSGGPANAYVYFSWEATGH